jgi:hypothetical protein
MNTANAPTWHLAQLNVARMLAPLDSPVMAGFVAQLAAINALADGSPGFVWRMVGDGDNATSLRPFNTDAIIVNLSVWESPESLQAYVYRSDHASVMRRRKEWFELFGSAYVVLWWVPVGHIPSVQEARERLEYLDTHGPTAAAFTFRQIFPPPQQPIEQIAPGEH